MAKHGGDSTPDYSSESDEEMGANQANNSGGLKELADQIGQLESRQQEDTSSVPSQLDTSSLILSRIKLWPPAPSTQGG